ncbi:polyketide cyclase [Frondihabitans sp. PAMC 28766]|uniref:SRPBCC family protein n=1 Tax=Frondihabitans sp. PAMC 28766 TaxID=1795630 RepID=UPI00078B2342|nr:SRPBCC family protein [Frondihabitans sp. PAMC 28766]AMM21358.1 polyketide cyclase [Frondihabitans sp. PAMC 28766]
MTVRHRYIAASPEAVFAVLADGWLFPSWVVGASRIRAVDDVWPAVGSKIHHSFGVWPVVVNDTTSVIAWSAPLHAEFEPRGWPLGEARVTIDVKPRGAGCVVRMEEHATSGPGVLVPEPLMAAAIKLRNREALQRLAWLAEGGAAR